MHRKYHKKQFTKQTMRVNLHDKNYVQDKDLKSIHYCSRCATHTCRVYMEGPEPLRHKNKSLNKQSRKRRFEFDYTSPYDIDALEGDDERFYMTTSN